MILLIFSAMKNHPAFTLTELLVVIGIVAILAAVSIPIYGNLQGATDLDSSSIQVAQLFRLARTLSFNGYRNMGYSVYFDNATNGFILYAGDDYQSRDRQADIAVLLDGRISVLPSGQAIDVHFAKWSGLASQSGHFEFSHQSAMAKRSISYNLLGAVDMD